jgi:hypothetical protein
MSRYIVQISYMHGAPEWRVLDDTTLVMFMTENIRRLHYEGDGYGILSIGQELGAGQLRMLDLRQVERYNDNEYLYWSYELTPAGPAGQDDAPELTELTFTVCIDGRA